jgi:hypothetical protein
MKAYEKQVQDPAGPVQRAGEAAEPSRSSAGLHGIDATVQQSPRMTAQRVRLNGLGAETAPGVPATARANRTGMPEALKSGIETLSGMAMDDVRVHYNSAEPAQLNAFAYAQGNDIHLGPGQEKHLPHEAWHVVQQRQGRVRATAQMAGVGLNDDAALEKEADGMGARAVLQGAGLGTLRSMRGPARQPGASTAAPVVQAKGSGGVKLAFQFEEDGGNADIATGIRLVRESWAEAKKERHSGKTTWMGANIKGAEYDKTKGGSANTSYATALETMGDEEDLLVAKLKLKPGLTYKADTKEISYQGEGMAAPVRIATLLLGADAYAANAKTEGQRDTFFKKGLKDVRTAEGDVKEYVDDSRGVKTRRYAYVEKNYYQMMDFFKTEKMTGRFQQYLQAGGERAGPEISTPKVRKEVASGGGTSDLTPVQIAMAHQMLGSSPEQRGVSLTSTEKVGGTIGNAGENFREADGFRLKIDLAKVPKDVLFLNHYSDQGLISQNLVTEKVKGMSTSVGETSKNKYKYGASVRKNRELYLEHIKPEWVTEIEHHESGGYGGTTGTKTSLTGLASFQSLANTYRDYWDAFDATLKKQKLVSPNKAQEKGESSANLVIAGYTAGSGKGPAVSAKVARDEVSEAALKDEYSQWHIGYIRGRVGKPNFTSSEDYVKEMTATKEKKDA